MSSPVTFHDKKLLRLSILISMWGLFFTAIAQAETSHFTVNMETIGKNGGEQYCPKLLALILNASKSPNEQIDFNFSDHHYTQDRWLAEIQREDKLNQVSCTTTTKERENFLHAIRVPIFKGLMGTRLLIIRKEDKNKFTNIKNLRELSTLKAGQGLSWTSTEVMRANNLPVEEGVNTEALYRMLKAGRIDYFPRGIFELDYESDMIKTLDLTVNDSLLLSFPMPIYFFVNKNNSEFSQRIEKGWEIILKNGEFEKLFLNYNPVKGALNMLNAHKWHVIRLENPYLSSETPFDRPEYWFDISPYEH